MDTSTFIDTIVRANEVELKFIKKEAQVHLTMMLNVELLIIL